MQLSKLSACITLLLVVTGCGLLKENTVLEMENGKYKNTTNGKTQKVWVQFEDSIVRFYPLPQKTSPTFFSFTELSDDRSVF